MDGFGTEKEQKGIKEKTLESINGEQKKKKAAQGERGQSGSTKGGVPTRPAP